MSFHSHTLEEDKQALKHVEREMQRRMRLLDMHLQHLHEKLPASCPCSLASHRCCLCQPSLCPWESKALNTRLDVEQDLDVILQELDSFQRSLNRLMDSSDDHKPLALVDVKGFDPKEVTLTVKDGKVKVSAKHEEKHSTTSGKEYNYRKFMKEINLPQGVSADEVIYSLGPSNILKIKVTCKGYPCLLSH